MNELVISRDKTAVSNSLVIAEYFNKRHDNVVRDIENLKNKIDLLKFEEMFEAGYYQDSYSRTQNMYYLNRDGFVFLVMGYTSERALQMKLKFLEAFNKMEEYIKDQMKNIPVATDPISILKTMVDALEFQKEKTNLLENKVEAVKKVLITEKNLSWRDDVTKKIKSIGYKLGNYKESTECLYKKLETEAKCDLKNRMIRYKKRLEKSGMTMTDINRANRIDVIEQDIKLRALFSKIVNIEYARINL